MCTHACPHIRVSSTGPGVVDYVISVSPYGCCSLIAQVNDDIGKPVRLESPRARMRALTRKYLVSDFSSIPQLNI